MRTELEFWTILLHALLDKPIANHGSDEGSMGALQPNKDAS